MLPVPSSPLVRHRKMCSIELSYHYMNLDEAFLTLSLPLDAVALDLYYVVLL